MSIYDRDMSSAKKKTEKLTFFPTALKTKNGKKETTVHHNFSVSFRQKNLKSDHSSYVFACPPPPSPCHSELSNSVFR